MISGDVVERSTKAFNSVGASLLHRFLQHRPGNDQVKYVKQMGQRICRRPELAGIGELQRRLGGLL